MVRKIRILDEEPDTAADLVLKINYDPRVGSAARAFEIAADLIHSLEDMDRVFTQTIDAQLETALIVEDLQKSSLKIFLRNVLKSLPDEALKDADIKKLIGHYLLKAKYAAIEWLDEPENENRKLTDLTEEIAELARATEVRQLPDYPPPNPTRLSQPLDRFQETKRKFTSGEGLTITLGKEDYTVNLKSDWLPSETSEDTGDEKELVNEQDLFLVIGKPDFIGNAKWTFKHGKKTLTLNILDEDWLSEFKKGSFPIKPGDALKVRLRVEHHYDAKGNLTSSSEEIVKVFEVIEDAGKPDDLFDGH